MGAVLTIRALNLGSRIVVPRELKMNPRGSIVRTFTRTL